MALMKLELEFEEEWSDVVRLPLIASSTIGEFNSTWYCGCFWEVLWLIWRHSIVAVFEHLRGVLWLIWTHGIVVLSGLQMTVQVLWSLTARSRHIFPIKTSLPSKAVDGEKKLRSKMVRRKLMRQVLGWVWTVGGRCMRVCLVWEKENWPTHINLIWGILILLAKSNLGLSQSDANHTVRWIHQKYIFL